MSAFPPSQKSKFKIAHSLQQLEDSLILTLKDKPLLKDNKQLNEDDDMFQNQQIQNQNRMKHNAQLRKKVKELADVTTSHMQTKQQGQGGILPHYDDYSYKNQEIQVEENGLVKNKKSNKVFKNTQNDFLTPQQANTTKLATEYNHVKIKKINRNSLLSNKKSLNGTSDLLDFLNQTAQDKFQQDDSKKRSASQAIQDALDSIRKKRILQFNSKRNVEQNIDISSIVGPSSSNGSPSVLYKSQQQQLLAKSIQKAQKKSLQTNKLSILQAIKQQQQNENQQAQKNNQSKQNSKPEQNNQFRTVQIQLNPISYRGDDKKYIRKQFDINGIKSGTSSAMFIKLPSERLVKKQQDKIPQSFKDITPQELEKMRQQVSFLEDKALGTGLSATLSFLRQNSLLGKQQQVGRTTDKSLGTTNNPEDRVKLQYRNQSGKLMKPKQAFRYLCATFHGQGPGKNKVQKRKRKQLQQLKMKQRLNTDGKLLNMLSEHQRKSNEAYMVLDIGKKAANKNNGNNGN